MAADTNDLKESPQTQHKTIHTLPPEILLHIFTLYEDRPCRGDTPLIWEIAKLTSVCSQWRTLILHTSAFWRHISAAPDLPWLTLCLKRSGDCTLDLEVITPFCADAGALALILPHARRIRSIFAHLSVYRDEYQMLRPLFDAGMPALETLELAPLGGFRYWRPVPPTIPWETVRWADDPATTACLPWLFVGRVAVPSSGSSWRSLRVLKVSDIIQPREPCTCSLSHLMYVIAHNPSLQELSLLFYCHLQQAPHTPAHAKPTHVPLPKMSLGRLRTLALQGTLWFVSTMMQHLDVPADIPNVDVRIRRASTDDPTEEAFARFLLSHCRPLLERMLDVVLAGDQEGQARLYSPKQPWPARRAVYEERLRLSLEDADAASNLEPRIRAFTRAMSSVPVRILMVKVSITRRVPSATPGETAAAAFWAGVFDAFSSVERLHIVVQAVVHPDVGIDLIELLCALQPASQHPRGGDEQEDLGAVRCPLLTRLSIHGEFGWLASGSCAVLQALAECVDTRARAAARVEDLDVHFWHRDSAQSLEEAHRAFLAQARSSVRRFACKVGSSAGCRSCIC